MPKERKFSPDRVLAAAATLNIPQLLTGYKRRFPHFDAQASRRPQLVSKPRLADNSGSCVTPPPADWRRAMLKPGLVGAARLVTIAAVFAGWFPTAVAQDATGPAAAPPASRPAPAAASPQTTTRPANVGSGVVGAALHELYVIPRDGDQAGTDSGGATAPQSSPRARTASSNAPAANRQRAATSKLPPSRTAPAASSSRGAKDAGSASAEPTHVYPGIPAGYRSGRRLSTNDREVGQLSVLRRPAFEVRLRNVRLRRGRPEPTADTAPTTDTATTKGDVYRFGFMQGLRQGQIRPHQQ